jgi:hypothetical protein
MSQQNRRSRDPERRMGLGFLALLLVPLLLFLHAPVLAAIVPGALITVASLDALQHRERQALPSAAVVGADDHDDLRRVASATPITASSRRVG